MTPARAYHNGKVVTGSEDGKIAQAFLVVGDRFGTVGNSEEVLATAEPSAELVDLGGRCVIPGLIDAHAHPIKAGLDELSQELPVVNTVTELLDWIRGQAATRAQGEWIAVPRIFGTRLLDLRLPTRPELDSAAPNNPVFLNGAFGGVLNSAGFARCGIPPDTDNPHFLRDGRTGELTGMLRKPALDLLKNLPRPQLSEEQRLEAARRMMRCYNSVGLTGVLDTVGNNDFLRHYEILRRRSELTLRVSTNYCPGKPRSRAEVEKALQQVERKTGDGDEWLRMDAFKVFIDGGILTGTACLREPWGRRAAEIFGVEDPDYRGICNYTMSELAEVVSAAHDRGWSFTAHATGDGAVELLLDAYESENATHAVARDRFSIIHGNFFSRNSLSRCREMGVLLDVQPAWFYKDADAMLGILGADRMQMFHPYRTVLAAGVGMAGGSDHMTGYNPVTSTNPYHPFIGLYTLITRTTERGNAIAPEEAIGRLEALAVYTRNAARRTGEEDIKGSIETGKLADFVVLDRDYLACSPSDLLTTEVLTTVVGGNVVYESHASPALPV